MWPFGKKAEPQKLPALVFKSGEEFLEYQNKFGQTDIQPRKRGIVALVLDAQKEFGTRQPVTIKADGAQQAVLKVASSDGGFMVNAQTPKAHGDRLKPGDTVIWLPWEYIEHPIMASSGIDKRFGWVGFIVAKIKPEIDPSNTALAVVCKYD